MKKIKLKFPPKFGYLIWKWSTPQMSLLTLTQISTNLGPWKYFRFWRSQCTLNFICETRGACWYEDAKFNNISTFLTCMIFVPRWCFVYQDLWYNPSSGLDWIDVRKRVKEEKQWVEAAGFSIFFPILISDRRSTPLSPVWARISPCVAGQGFPPCDWTGGLLIWGGGSVQTQPNHCFSCVVCTVRF